MDSELEAKQMTTFFLILMLIDSLTFGGAPTPKLRKAKQRSVVSDQWSASAPDSRTPSPVCFTDGEGNVTCYPIDQADKFKR